MKFPSIGLLVNSYGHNYMNILYTLNLSLYIYASSEMCIDLNLICTESASYNQMEQICCQGNGNMQTQPFRDPFVIFVLDMIGSPDNKHVTLECMYM